MLSNAGLVIIDVATVSKVIYYSVNILSFLFCWLLIAFLASKFPIYKILGVAGLLVAAFVAERFIDVRNNPVTVPLIILFWLGVTSLILPQFFKKYNVVILSVYGLAISYHFFIFKTTPDYSVDQRLNFANFMLMPIPAFAALWLYEQWRWLKTLQADKGKAELALLKSQINPHFFFNTLNNLYGLVVEQSEQAPEVVLKLSDMMRYTIYEGKEDLVSLREEVRYLENYIELHKMRYQKKVDIQFIHEVQVDLKVAPLLFIVLLENAFKHGVEKMREQAFIHLRMQVQNKQVFFTIENSFEESESNHKPGIGLENLKKRLDYLYPNRHELVIEEKGSRYKIQLNLELI
ncbi:MAG: hypothetical protein Sapg2KO_09950 [Saprospiraceae bacterium]